MWWFTKALLWLLGIGTALIVAGDSTDRTVHNLLGLIAIYGVVLICFFYLVWVFAHDLFNYLSFLDERPRRRWGWVLGVFGGMGLIGEPASEITLGQFGIWYIICFGLIALAWVVNRWPFAKRPMYVRLSVR